MLNMLCEKIVEEQGYHICVNEIEGARSHADIGSYNKELLRPPTLKASVQIIRFNTRGFS